MWTGDALDEELAIQEFAKIIMEGVKEDPAVRRATMAMDVEQNIGFRDSVVKVMQANSNASKKYSISQV